MSIKIISSQEEVFRVIKSAVDNTVNLIRKTYGPASSKVIISKVLNKLIVDDGVQIARDLELEDASENAALHFIRETAVRTNDRAGDGTTGSLIMLQAIISEVANLARKDGRAIEKELNQGFEEAKEQLLAMSKPVKTKAELEQVARVSFDDEKVSKLIADTCFKLGKDGSLTVDRSGTMETFVDMTEGLKINRGFISPYMVTNSQRMEAVIEKPYILLTDYRLTEVNDILPAMNALVEKGVHQLVLVCENIEQSALSTAILNKVQGKFNLLAVNTPVSGEERTIFLEDIAILTGARVFSEKKGDKLEEVKLEDFGRAQRFISRKDESVLVGPKAARGKVSSAINAVKSAISTAKNEIEKKSLKERLARFTNKVAVIKVGAATDNEERALRYKVEDAINATMSAFRGGVVPGAGCALASIKTSSHLLNEALKRPNYQLLENCGYNPDSFKFGEFIDKKGESFNVVTGESGDFRKVGVMDPVEVLIAGIQSAVSIASLLVTTTGIIVEPPHKPKQE